VVSIHVSMSTGMSTKREYEYGQHRQAATALARAAASCGHRISST
jgi:hypothetical protein